MIEVQDPESTQAFEGAGSDEGDFVVTQTEFNEGDETGEGVVLDGADDVVAEVESLQGLRSLEGR